MRSAVASGLSARTEELVEIFLHVSIIRLVITQKTNNVQNISAEMATREPAQIPHTILMAVDAVWSVDRYLKANRLVVIHFREV